MEAKELKWWLRWKTLVCGAIAAAVLIAVVFILIRWRSNVVLAKELRVEIESWLQTIPKIPDSENGMLPVLSGLEAFKDDLPERFNAKDFSVENESDKALLRQYITEKEQPLAQIYKGLGYEKFMFPGDYSKGYSRMIPSLLQFRIAARLLELKGNLLESEGKKSEALNEYLDVLRLGETLSSERDIISHMIEVAVLDRAFPPVIRVLSESSVGEKEIDATLQLLLGLHGGHGSLFTMSDHDYYSNLIFIADLIEGKIDFYEAKYLVSKGHYFERMLMSKYRYNYRYDVEICRKVAKIWQSIDPAEYYALPPEGKYEETYWETIGIPKKITRRFFAFALHAPCVVVMTLAVTETLWRGAIALSAVRLFEARNGRLPKNLQELGKLVPEEFLIDPFSGKEIVYRLAGNDFYLYSVGLDGVDQNGAGVPYFREEKSACDLQDIIFHAPAAGKGG